MAKEDGMRLSEKDITLEITTYPDGKKENKIFPWRDIVSVRVTKGVKTTLIFFKKPYERIEVQTTNPETPQYEMPILLYRSKYEEDFDDYVDQLKKYSEKKNFTFKDER